MPALAPKIPDYECEYGNGDHDRNEYGCHFVCKALNGRLAPLRLFNKFYDLAKGGLFSYLCRSERNTSHPVYGASKDHVPDSLLHREAFTGKHGFIHC